MSTATPNETATAPLATQPVSQLYVAHCTIQDSLHNQVGFGVRAASRNTEPWFNFARGLPGLDLPLGMSAQGRQPRELPRRLALIRPNENTVVLCHTYYAPASSDNRKHSYFTHVLLFERDTITPRQAIATWSAPFWVGSYPEGATKELGHFAWAPSLAESALGEDAVTELCAGPARELVRMTLQGFRLLLEPGPAPPRDRLIIQANPDLVARLLLALVRLLPGAFTNDLTFSTYESSRDRLRGRNWDVRIIGTCSNPDSPKLLDTDLREGSSYAIDALGGPSSNVFNSRDPAFDYLIALAARGRWDEIELHHKLAGLMKGSPTLTEVLRQGAQLWAYKDKLDQGTARFVDAKKFPDSEMGSLALHDALQDQRSSALLDRTWPLIKDFIHYPDIAAKFKGLIRARLDDLVAATIESLNADGDWKARWDYAEPHLGTDPDKARYFDGLLRQANRESLALPNRIDLFLIWRRLNGNPRALPVEHHWLLAIQNDTELEALAQLALPRWWVGQLAAAALARRLDSPPALEVMRGGGDALKGAVDHLAPDLLNRALVLAEADAPAWDTLWNDDANRKTVLGKLDPEAPFAVRLWDRWVGPLTDECLVGPEERRTELTRLLALRDDLARRVPRQALAVLDDWDILYRHLNGIEPPSNVRKLLTAKVARGLSRQGLLQRRFADTMVEFNRLAPTDAHEATEVLRAFAHCAAGFYERTDEALRNWVELGRVFQIGSYVRPTFQAAFLLHAVPVDEWDDLLRRTAGILDPGARAKLNAFRAAGGPPQVVAVPGGLDLAKLHQQLVDKDAAAGAHPQRPPAGRALARYGTLAAMLLMAVGLGGLGSWRAQTETKRRAAEARAAQLRKSLNDAEASRDALQARLDALEKSRDQPREDHPPAASREVEKRAELERKLQDLTNQLADSERRVAELTASLEAAKRSAQDAPLPEPRVTSTAPVFHKNLGGLQGVAYFGANDQGSFVWADGTSDLGYSAPGIFPNQGPGLPAQLEDLAARSGRRRADQSPLPFTYATSESGAPGLVAVWGTALVYWPGPRQPPHYYTKYREVEEMGRPALGMSADHQVRIAWVARLKVPTNTSQNRSNGLKTYLCVWGPTRDDELVPVEVANVELPRVAVRRDGLIAAISRSGAIRFFWGNDGLGPVLIWNGDAPPGVMEDRIGPGGHQPTSGCAFSPDSRRLVVGCENGVALNTYQPEIGLTPEKRHGIIIRNREFVSVPESRTTCLAFRPDSKWLAVGTSKAQVHLIDLTTTPPSTSRVINCDAAVVGIAFNLDGTQLAIATNDGGSKGSLTVWDINQAPAPTAVKSDGGDQAPSQP